jgi:adenylate cyclase
MRLIPSIRLGAKRFPEKVSQRLRRLSIGTWMDSATHAFCTLLSLFALPRRLRFGTERYPEKVARRLRTLNIGTWIGTVLHAFFALTSFFYAMPWLISLGHLVWALLYAGVPLLHRLGRLAGPAVAIIFIYTDVSLLIFLFGTGYAGQTFYMGAVAVSALYFGTEYVALSWVAAAVAAILIIVLQITVPYDRGLLPGSAFYVSLITVAVTSCGFLLLIVSYALDEAARAEAVAEREHERSERLLANILPAPIAARLKSESNIVIADKLSNTTILFVDIVGSTQLAESMAPEALVGLLNSIFSEIDDLTEKYDLEKIKTIGDAYMLVAGAPNQRADHAEAVAAMSLEIKERFAKVNKVARQTLDFRIGIYSGTVVAGVIGKKKFSYDLWGDAVNTAARLEAHGLPGEIQVSAYVRDLLIDKFQFVERGLVELKGKGQVQTFLLKGRRIDVPPLVPLHG